VSQGVEYHTWRNLRLTSVTGSFSSRRSSRESIPAGTTLDTVARISALIGPPEGITVARQVTARSADLTHIADPSHVRNNLLPAASLVSRAAATKP
jgi:hypothetical protein